MRSAPRGGTAGGGEDAPVARQHRPVHQRPGVQHDNGMKDILQLPHIARPGMADQVSFGVRGKPAEMFAFLARKALQVIIRQVQNILRAAAQGRMKTETTCRR